MIFWFEHRGMRFRIHEGETLIGRGARSSLFIDVPSVSREHALVRLAADQVELTDLGSSNGTFVNEQRLTGTCRLRPGDQVKLGGALLVLVAAAESSAPVAIVDGSGRDAGPPQSEHGTELEFSSIEVLESLVVRGAVSQDPVELALMVQGSIDRLLETAHRKAQPIGPDHAARIIAIAEIIAGWVEAGALDAWVRATARRLGS